jgi:hypothetical protein
VCTTHPVFQWKHDKKSPNHTTAKGPKGVETIDHDKWESQKSFLKKVCGANCHGPLSPIFFLVRVSKINMEYVCTHVCALFMFSKYITLYVFLCYIFSPKVKGNPQNIGNG